MCVCVCVYKYFAFGDCACRYAPMPLRATCCQPTLWKSRFVFGCFIQGSRLCLDEAHVEHADGGLGECYFPSRCSQSCSREISVHARDIEPAPIVMTPIVDSSSDEAVFLVLGTQIVPRKEFKEDAEPSDPSSGIEHSGESDDEIRTSVLPWLVALLVTFAIAVLKQVLVDLGSQSLLKCCRREPRASPGAAPGPRTSTQLQDAGAQPVHVCDRWKEFSQALGGFHVSSTLASVAYGHARAQHRDEFDESLHERYVQGRSCYDSLGETHSSAGTAMIP